MGDYWKTIEGENHVLSLNDYSTLKIGKYRNEIREQFQSIAQSLLSHGKQQIALAKLAQMQTVAMQFQQIDWVCSSPEGIDCEILFLGEETWQKGKLRIKVSTEFPEIFNESKPINDVFFEGIDEASKSQDTNFLINVRLEFLAVNVNPIPEIITKEKATEEKIESVFSEEALQSTIEIKTKKLPEDSIASPHVFTFKSNS